MDNTKQNAVIFCSKSEMPDYMLQVTSWLEDKFNLHYRKMPHGRSEELNYAWKSIDGPVTYVFVVLDLRADDKQLIKELDEKTKEEMNLFLDDSESKWPDSFQLILNLKGQWVDEVDLDDLEDEEIVDGFSPCLVTFCEDSFDGISNFLGLWGVDCHLNKNNPIFSNKVDPIFADKKAFFAEIELRAEHQIAIIEQVKGFSDED
jgi:hypothetical protein